MSGAATGSPPAPEGRDSAARRVVRLLEPLVGLVGLLILWQVVSALAANATLVPPPLQVGEALLAMARAELWEDIGASLVHLGSGYGLGLATGLLLALLAARFTAFEAVVDPAVEFFRPISAIAWIPIAILTFGVGRGVPIFLIFYASIFPVFVNTLDGIRRVDPGMINAARMLGASRRMVVTHVVIPAAMPAILTGARLSLGVGWVAMVAGELVGADAGLGWRILLHQEFFAMDGVMATIIVIGILGYAADALLRIVQAHALRWKPPGGAA